jgi:hypothetical protein
VTKIVRGCGSGRGSATATVAGGSAAAGSIRRSSIVASRRASSVRLDGRGRLRLDGRIDRRDGLLAVSRLAPAAAGGEQTQGEHRREQ